MMRKENDNRCLEAFRSLGNSSKEAFDAIYARYKGKMIAYIRLSFNLEDQVIEDIVSETFITIWETRESVATRENPEMWMYRVAKNKAIDAAKKRHTYDVDALDERVLISLAETPESQLLYKELENKIYAAMAVLSPAEREVFERSKMMDIPHEELAAQLGVRKQTIRNRLSSALKKIRLELANLGR